MEGTYLYELTQMQREGTVAHDECQKSTSSVQYLQPNEKHASTLMCLFDVMCCSYEHMVFYWTMFRFGWAGI